MSDKQFKIIIGMISVVILSLIGLMYSGVGIQEMFDSRFPDFDKSILPMFNAIFNFGVFVSLIIALKAIKSKNIEKHRKFIYIAFTLSTLFLINYVLYHMISESTKFGGEGVIRNVYFFILLTHILLATVSFPFILYTALLGQTMQVEKHRKIAKIVMPVWLYVALTGVLVYLLIYPYYT